MLFWCKISSRWLSSSALRGHHSAKFSGRISSQVRNMLQQKCNKIVCLELLPAPVLSTLTASFCGEAANLQPHWGLKTSKYPRNGRTWQQNLRTKRVSLGSPASTKCRAGRFGICCCRLDPNAARALSGTIFDDATSIRPFGAKRGEEVIPLTIAMSLKSPRKRGMCCPSSCAQVSFFPPQGFQD